MFDAVNSLDTVKNIFERVVDRIFAGFNGKTLVSHILQGDDFTPDFFLCHLLSGDVFVPCVIRTVFASIDTVIGQIERGKHNDTVAVKFLFDLLCQCINFLI